MEFELFGWRQSLNVDLKKLEIVPRRRNAPLVGNRLHAGFRSGMNSMTTKTKRTQHQWLIVGRISLVALISSVMLLAIATIPKSCDCNPVIVQEAKLTIRGDKTTVAQKSTPTNNNIKLKNFERRRRQSPEALKQEAANSTMKNSGSNSSKGGGGSVNSSGPMKLKRPPTRTSQTSKRFKSSFNLGSSGDAMNNLDQSNREVMANNNSTTHSVRFQTVATEIIDINNNASSRIYANDNNNTIDTGSSGASFSDDNNNNSQQLTRNVNSINGTIDLSQYGQRDVDRLYGDALLVYFKNFNE